MDFFKLFILGIQSIYLGIIKFFRYFGIGVFNIVTLIPRYFWIGILTIFGKRKRERSSKESKRLSLAIVGTSLFVYLVCVFLFSRWYVQGLKIKYLTNDIINSTEIIEKDNDSSNDDDNNSNTTPSDTPDNGNSNGE